MSSNDTHQLLGGAISIGLEINWTDQALFLVTKIQEHYAHQCECLSDALFSPDQVRTVRCSVSPRGRQQRHTEPTLPRERVQELEACTRLHDEASKYRQVLIKHKALAVAAILVRVTTHVKRGSMMLSFSFDETERKELADALCRSDVNSETMEEVRAFLQKQSETQWGQTELTGVVALLRRTKYREPV